MLKQTPINTYLHQVPYFSQLDSETWQHDRMCQSSAIAMVLNYLYAGTTEDPDFARTGSWDDDDYLKYVNRWGDTVIAGSHQRGLDELGIEATFKMNGSADDIVNLLARGIPVPIGILHHGSIHSPRGYGHWVTIIGHTDHHYIVHDPWGELNLMEGGFYDGEKGECILYHKWKLERRWLINSKNDGWYWDFTRKYKTS